MLKEDMNSIILPVEAFDYVQLAFQRYHNHQLNCLLTLDGHIQEDILQKAVILSFDDLPQLDAVFKQGEWIHEIEKPSFEIELRKNRQFVHKDIERLFAETDLIKQEYQIRVVILRESANDRIVIIANHMLMDAMDMKRYLYLLCGLYNGNAAKHRYIGKSRSASWVKNKKVVKRPSVSKHAKKEERLSLKAGDIPVFLTEKIPYEQFQALIQRTKKSGVTINEFLMAAYYKAIEKTFGYETTTLCCSIDLRRYIDEKDELGLCNQTGNIFCNIENLQKLKFEQLLQQIHKQMEIEKEKGYCLGQIKLLNKVFHLFSHKHSMKLIDKVISNPGIAFTNLGIIDEKQLVFDGIKTRDCFLTGSLKQVPNFQVAASTFRGELTLGINMVTTESEIRRLQLFLADYIAIIKENCDK